MLPGAPEKKQDQHQADRDDHRRDVQIVVDHADQKADQRAAAEAAENKSGIAEVLGKNDADNGGQHDVRADGEVKQPHHDDEVQTAAADRIDDGGLQIGIQIAGRSEIARSQDFEDKIEEQKHREQQTQAIGPGALPLLKCFRHGFATSLLKKRVRVKDPHPSSTL